MEGDYHKRNEDARGCKSRSIFELLVTIVIIGTLSTISVSTYGNYQEKARLAVAQSMAKQIENLVLAKNASTEDVVLLAWFNFNGENDTSSSIPYILDKSGFKNHCTRRSTRGGNLFNTNVNTAMGSGKSLRIKNRSHGTDVNRDRALSSIQNGKFTLSFWLKLNEFPSFRNEAVSLEGGHMIRIKSDRKIYFGSVPSGWR